MTSSSPLSSAASNTAGDAMQLDMFVNVGGYLPQQLAEQHAFGLFVAPSADAAKHKAKAALLPGHDQAHKDKLNTVDDCLLLTEVGGWHVTLTPNPHGQPQPPRMQSYHPI